MLGPIVLALISLLQLVYAGDGTHVGPYDYDYSATTKCLAEPLPPQYGGGMIKNPTFDMDFYGWKQFGHGKIVVKTSGTGNKFLVVHNRTQLLGSAAQVVSVTKDMMYTYSAWVQISKGEEVFIAKLVNSTGHETVIGTVIAKSGCWSFLKGGFQVKNDDEHARIFFEGKKNSSYADLWIDSVSLKPFSQEQWIEQQQKAIQEVRMNKVNIHVTDINGRIIEGAHIHLDETKPQFIIGCATTEAILHDKGYQDWFTASGFQATTFDNEMKWYFTEGLAQGAINYDVPDAMVAFAEQHGIAVRGHNILWQNIYCNPSWVTTELPQEKTLPHMAILNASVEHINSIVPRYKAKVIAWDVINENMHWNFYDNHISPSASAMFFQITHALDPETPLFLNDYNVLSLPDDIQTHPPVYVENLNQIRSFPGNENLTVRIGIQGHFSYEPIVAHYRAGLDYLGSTKMPIWVTELDVRRGPNQADWLAKIMRDAFSHPAVEGMILWSGWKPNSCNETCMSDWSNKMKGCPFLCLMDDNYKNTHVGDVVDSLRKEWRTTNVTGITDKDGDFKSTLFKGEYTLTTTHPQYPNSFIGNISVKGKLPLDFHVSL